MKTTRLLFPVGAASVALFLAGCATPASRIQNHPELFANYPAEQQELIKQGRVAVGFDMTEVRLALGTPTHVRTNKNDSGATAQTWSYSSFEAPEDGPVYPSSQTSSTRITTAVQGAATVSPMYLGDPGSHEYERLRIVFDDTGHVSTIALGKGFKLAKS